MGKSKGKGRFTLINFWSQLILDLYFIFRRQGELWNSLKWHNVRNITDDSIKNGGYLTSKPFTRSFAALTPGREGGNFQYMMYRGFWCQILSRTQILGQNSSKLGVEFGANPGLLGSFLRKKNIHFKIHFRENCNFRNQSLKGTFEKPTKFITLRLKFLDFWVYLLCPTILRLEFYGYLYFSVY